MTAHARARSKRGLSLKVEAERRADAENLKGELVREKC